MLKAKRDEYDQYWSQYSFDQCFPRSGMNGGSPPKGHDVRDNSISETGFLPSIPNEIPDRKHNLPNTRIMRASHLEEDKELLPPE